MNNPMQMVNAFMQFRQNYQGNPQADVQRLVSSGRISQQQLNQLQSAAASFRRLLGNYR